MKYLLSLIMMGVFISLPLAGMDSLNQLEYKINLKDNSYVTRNKTITITQEEKLIATVSSYWNLASDYTKATYVLKDDTNQIVGLASPYFLWSQPYKLYFDLKNGSGNLLGTLIVSLSPTLAAEGIVRPVGALLLSVQGYPILEDDYVFFSWTTKLEANVPGTNEMVASIVSDSYFWNDKWHAQVNNLEYVAQMNIFPELFLLYSAIRADRYSYSYGPGHTINIGIKY